MEAESPRVIPTMRKKANPPMTSENGIHVGIGNGGRLTTRSDTLMAGRPEQVITADKESAGGTRERSERGGPARVRHVPHLPFHRRFEREWLSPEK